jgi:hypothetical protein
VDSVFIIVDKFLSQSGAILFFHSNNLQVLRQIKEFFDNYSMLIQMKWAMVNSLPLISTKDPKLNLLLFLISCQSCSIVAGCFFQSSMPFYFLIDFI